MEKNMPGYTATVSVVYTIDLPDEYVDSWMSEFDYADGTKLNRRQVVKKLVEAMPRNKTFSSRTTIEKISRYDD